MSENKMIKDLTVEELKDIIKDTIREELMQISQTCLPYQMPISIDKKYDTGRIYCTHQLKDGKYFNLQRMGYEED